MSNGTQNNRCIPSVRRDNMKKNFLMVLIFVVVQIVCLQGVSFSATTTLVQKCDTWNYTYLSFDLLPKWPSVGYNSFDWSKASWTSGSAAFGNSNQLPFNTFWFTNTDMALMKQVSIDGKINGAVTLNVAVDNGFILFINGTEVARREEGGYTSYWEYTIPLDNTPFKIGQNTFQVFIEDNSGKTFFDMQMTADVIPASMPSPTPTPIPGTSLLLGTGLLGLLGIRRRFSI
jgi:hypothetical protein